MSTSMQAAVIRAHGGPEALKMESIERRASGADEILVQVLSCALNHFDIFVRRGMPGVSLPLPHIAGGDIVGVVESAGGPAGESLVGRRVLLDPLVGRHALGENLWGGLAEYVVAPAANAILLPQAGDVRRFAALPISYGAARRMIMHRARVEEGETVVVLGAGGGVGVACVQIGVQAGARVIALSSSEKKRKRLLALGASEVVDSSAEDWGAQVWRLTGKQGADVVIDYIGGETWPTSVRTTRRGGRLVTCGATSGFEAITDLRYVWTRELNILGSSGWGRDDLEVLVQLVEGGQLDPVVHGIFPLSRVREAMSELEERRAFGKVLVVPDTVFEVVP